MKERLSRFLPLSFDKVKREYGREYLRAIVRLLIKVNAKVNRSYHYGGKEPLSKKCDEFFLSYTGGRISPRYTVEVDGKWYCIRLRRYFHDKLYCLPTDNLSDLSKLYNFIVKHKKEFLNQE